MPEHQGSPLWAKEEGGGKASSGDLVQGQSGYGAAMAEDQLCF